MDKKTIMKKELIQRIEEWTKPSEVYTFSAEDDQLIIGKIEIKLSSYADKSGPKDEVMKEVVEDIYKIRRSR